MASRQTAVVASTPDRCPCGHGAAYVECCGPLHQGARAAATAEHLMRSRYSAFAVGDAAYLARTWASATRPADLRLDPDQRWVGLTVEASEGGGPFDAEGEVVFVARYRLGAASGELRERSRFVREAGRWVYLGPSTSRKARAHSA